MDIETVRRLIRQETRFRTGLGFDVHRFEAGRPLVLGGVEVPHELGLAGHSDADVITHAAMDAVLGAAGLPDIGTWFPDTDEAYRGADSIGLAEKVAEQLEQRGFELVSLDIMVMAEQPKLKPHRTEMQKRLGAAFRLPPERVGLKATTTERLGFTGRQEGIAAMASALVREVWDETGAG